MSTHEQVAFARSTDPDTSHWAAANQTEDSLYQRMIWITRLVTEAPDLSIPDYVDMAMAETGAGSWLYGTLSTVFHFAEEYGFIRKNGKLFAKETQEWRYKFIAVPPEEQETAKQKYLDMLRAKVEKKEAKEKATAERKAAKALERIKMKALKTSVRASAKQAIAEFKSYYDDACEMSDLVEQDYYRQKIAEIKK